MTRAILLAAAILAVSIPALDRAITQAAHDAITAEVAANGW